MDNLEIAKTAFKQILLQFPNLSMRIHTDEPVDICMDIPAQKGLKFEIKLNLQNSDELHLSISNFWCEWFPCSKPEKVKEYITAVTGLLLGKYRILEHYRGKKAVKAELQMPQNGSWKTIATWSTVWLPIPWVKKYKIIQNA